jgi:two-component system response regulator VanR
MEDYMHKILVIEDDYDIQEMLRNFLLDAGYQIDSAYDGIQGYEYFSKNKYNLILLDIMLPKIDGFGVCELIRKESNVPLIMITALDGEDSQIKGFDLQVDDYITKPFSIPILLRKIAAILRRSKSSEEQPNEIKFKDLILKVDEYKTFVAGTQVDLTPREFEVLQEFLLHQGKVLTRQMLLNSLWKYDFYGDERIVDTHIKNVRKKLDREYIETIRGVGYRIDKEN